jgi:hypothetical protein
VFEAERCNSLDSRRVDDIARTFVYWAGETGEGFREAYTCRR